MPVEIKKDSILARKFHAALVTQIDPLIESAATGNPDAKFNLALKIEEIAAKPLNTAALYQQALEIYEELGEAGDVEAMERAAVLYATGAASTKISFEPGKTPDTTTIVTKPAPDLANAYRWALRAEKAGSVVARDRILPKLDELITKDVLNTPRP